MGFTITGIENNRIEKIMELCVSMVFFKFGLSNDIKVDVDVGEIESGLNGMMIDVEENEFLILISNRKGREDIHIIQTLFHELVHVKQHVQQGLGELLDDLNKPPYDQRWWEIEANAVAKEMMEVLTKLLIVHADVDIDDLQTKLGEYI